MNILLCGCQRLRPANAATSGHVVASGRGISSIGFRRLSTALCQMTRFLVKGHLGRLAASVGNTQNSDMHMYVRTYVHTYVCT